MAGKNGEKKEQNKVLFLMNRALLSILHSKVTNYFSMPRESYFLIKWEMIFSASALLDFMACGCVGGGR